MAKKSLKKDSNLKQLAQKALFEQVNDPVIIFDRTGVIRFINRAVSRVAGYQPKDLIGKNFKTMRIITPESIPVAKKYFAQAMRGKRVPPHELSILKKNKEIITGISTISVLKHQGKNIGAVILFHDFTEHKNIDKILQKEKEWSETLIDRAPNIIVGLGEKSKILLFNKYAEKLTGYRAKNVIGKRWIELFIPLKMKKELYGVWNGIVGKKAIGHNFTNLIKTKKGERLISWHNDVLKEDGKFKMVLSIGQDITEEDRLRKANEKAIEKKAKIRQIKISQKELQKAAFTLARTEAELEKQKEIDKMKTEFVSIASHQLRTPLTSISWYLESLLDETQGKLNGAQKKYMELAAYGGKRLTRLLNDLLNVSRLETGRIKINSKKTNLKEFLKDQIRDIGILAEEKECKIKLLKPARPVNLDIDQILLRQVINNLLTNAIKFSPRKRCEISLKLAKQKIGWVISVSDKGIGIPKKEQDKIFEKFYRTSNAMKMVPGGTGLGLYIAKLVVEAWGGKIWYKTARAKGTTFYFSIPSKGMKSKRGEIGLA